MYMSCVDSVGYTKVLRYSDVQFATSIAFFFFHICGSTTWELSRLSLHVSKRDEINGWSGAGSLRGLGYDPCPIV